MFLVAIAWLGHPSVTDGPHLSLQTDAVQLQDSAFDPASNFKSNTVKSNKKYAMYRQPMSRGQDLTVNGQREMRRPALDLWTENADLQHADFFSVNQNSNNKQKPVIVFKH